MPDDIWTLWEWRNLDKVRAVSINDRQLARADHQTWFDSNFAQMRDRMIMVEWNGAAVAWFHITRFDGSDGGWAYALGVTSGTLGLGALLPLLGLGYAFERLHARTISGQVLDSNFNVQSLFARYGIPTVPIVAEPVSRADGSVVTVTSYEVTDRDWPIIKANALRELPARLGDLLVRSLEAPVDGQPARLPHEEKVPEMHAVETTIRRALLDLLTEDDIPATELTRDSVLLDTGLDSLGLAVLVTRLESTLGYDPFAIMIEAVYPRTLGEFVDIYEKYAPQD